MAIDELRRSRGHSVILRGHDFTLRSPPIDTATSLAKQDSLVVRRTAVRAQREISDYVPLRVHSHYSFLDSTLSPTAVVALAKRQGLKAVALTDTGNLHGAVEFVQAARQAGVKPILGMELGVGDKSLLLYVESARGYYNLCRLLSRHAERTASHPDDASVANQQRRSLRREVLSGLTEGLIAVSDDIQMADLFPQHFYQLAVSRDTVRRAPFFKEHLQRLYLQGGTERERAKIESYYRVMAVVVVSRDEGCRTPVPSDWVSLERYVDAATGQTYTDYRFEAQGGVAVVCLAQGASPDQAMRTITELLDLSQPACLDDVEQGIQGVRISELSFNELRTSCLHARTIARMQFYTSFSADETLNILRGNTSEPTDENIIEALRPCLILKYKDHCQEDSFYCRVKPAEMVRVKYRTPTGENLNPCWDASQIVGLLDETEMQNRYQDVSYDLLLIEGEKKAAMLAQVMLDLNIKTHVISLPGVWMGVTGPKKNRQLVSEIARFRLRDHQGTPRKCLIFFDNDKAFNPAVMDALLQTAGVMQREGAEVFVPHLPFGKRIKGADDFALMHCRSDRGLNYGPLVDVIESAVRVPKPPPEVKYPGEDQKRLISRHLEEAERIHDLQEMLGGAADPANHPKLRELFLLQAIPVLRFHDERQAAQFYDCLDARGRLSVLVPMLKDNLAMRALTEACAGIPAIQDGITLRQYSADKIPVEKQPALF